MSERGYIALARGVLDHSVVGAGKSYSDFEAWVWLLFEAAYKPRRICITNGRARETVQLERGQLSHSLRYMAKAWGWSSDKRVRTFLNRLKTDAQIDTQTDHLQTVITICKYELYQNPETARDRQTDAQTDAPRTQHGRKEEESKKVIKESSSAQSAARENGKSRKKPATPLSDAWSPSGQSVEKAKALGLTSTEIEREARKFCNHARQNDRRVVLWDAAFDNWCIKAGEILKRSPPVAERSSRYEAPPGSPEWQAHRAYFSDTNQRAMVRFLDARTLEGRSYVFESQWPPGHQTS
jgi:hypothetical protein